MNLMSKPPLGLKPEKASADPAYLDAVRELPCCICHEFGLSQTTPTAAHHCIHGRHSTRKSPDRMAIPLCEGCHQGMFDTTKIALHREPLRWRAAYGDDTDWISWTEERISQ